MRFCFLEETQLSMVLLEDPFSVFPFDKVVVEGLGGYGLEKLVGCLVICQAELENVVDLSHQVQEGINVAPHQLLLLQLDQLPVDRCIDISHAVEIGELEG